MNERLACALNGVDFCSLDPRLFINDMEEQPRERVDTAATPCAGQRIIGVPGRSELSVTIRFMVKERDRARRAMILDQVNGWAAEPGWLTISTRPGKRLAVICTQYAGQAALRWSEEARIVLTAYQEAHWQEIHPVSVTFSGQEGGAALIPAGSRPCCLEAEIGNASNGTVNSLSLSVNGRTMAFANLNLASGDTLRLYYDAAHILRAEVNGQGKLSCRTPESADELPLLPGRSNAVAAAADGACSFLILARGEWL